MKLRAWLERGVIIVAALATIATSRKGWVVEATKPPDDSQQARIVVVEASHEPQVQIHVGRSYEHARPLDAGATWPGKARYLVSAGTELIRVQITDKCNGGSCKKCEPPSGARVRIASITPVRTWKLETTSSPEVQPTNMNPDKWTTFRVMVDASHPVRLVVQSTGPQGFVSNWNGEHHVDFGQVQVATTFTWSVTATIEEACLDATKPCEPPATAHVSIPTIARDSDAR